MAELAQIQWFPGHMAKTRRLIKESLPIIDCVAEIIDARIPESSRNPELDVMCSAKPRIILLNKADLADEGMTSVWVEHFKEMGFAAIPADCKSGKGISRFPGAVRDMLKDKMKKNAEKGMAGRKIRIMVAGIPNSGKSTFINRMSGSKKLKTEDRPGVTRAKQWIDLGDGFEMMDTPGILWPKFEDKVVGEKLAFCGAVKDDIIDRETLAARLLETLRERYPGKLSARYKLHEPLPESGQDLLELIGRRRGMLISGGGVDTERAAAMLIDEFRSGKLGRITLERP